MNSIKALHFNHTLTVWFKILCGGVRRQNSKKKSPSKTYGCNCICWLLLCSKFLTSFVNKMLSIVHTSCHKTLFSCFSTHLDFNKSVYSIYYQLQHLLNLCSQNTHFVSLGEWFRARENQTERRYSASGCWDPGWWMCKFIDFCCIPTWKCLSLFLG